ncbi:MAG: cupin domain-containing protein [Pantoea sp.]|uniref:cupin domain-containing protein n=1 Tax=Pantoea sp. TaxID=69393 RepID=UPI00239444E3|nr:cupin domain-containing protein [Pantoea sp.]MDE1186865.1 cupin domain-containing protein [Pantoea sp.]
MQELVKGPGAVLAPEEGDSYWQPGPHFGHMTIKVSPSTHPSNMFSMGTQILPAGCHIRSHGHARNDEILFIHAGSGRAVIDGDEHGLETGSTVVLGRFVEHAIYNDGPGDMEIVWFFTPPGLEHVVEGAGKPRRPGEPPPEHLERPADIARILDKAGYATAEQIRASVKPGPRAAE